MGKDPEAFVLDLSHSNSKKLALDFNLIRFVFQVLFPLFKQHHKEIEEQAEKAKQSIKDKLGEFFKNEKKENGKNETLDKIENFFKAKDKPEKPEKDEKSLKQN